MTKPKAPYAYADLSDSSLRRMAEALRAHGARVSLPGDLRLVLPWERSRARNGRIEYNRLYEHSTNFAARVSPSRNGYWCVHCDRYRSRGCVRCHGHDCCDIPAWHWSVQGVFNRSGKRDGVADSREEAMRCADESLLDLLREEKDQRHARFQTPDTRTCDPGQPLSVLDDEGDTDA